MRYLKSIFKPLPSLFDIAVGGLMLIFSIHGDDNRSLFLALYFIFIISLTIGMKPKREYRSIPLGLITTWAFVCMFVHSFALYPKSITYNWKLFYLTVEGFLYIFLGALFIRSVAVYSTNLRFIYFLIPCALIVLVPGLMKVGSSTPLVALALSVLIYLWMTRRKVAVIATLLGVGAVIFNWSWLVFKFRSRPVAWGQMILNMFYNPIRYDGGQVIDPGVELSPVVEKFLSIYAPVVLKFKAYLASIFGSGFTNFLNSDYKWVTIGDFQYGWAHKHNDFLNLANSLGPVILIPLVWFIAQTLKTIGKRPIMILFTTILLVSMSQLTLYDPAKAAVCVTITALTLTDGLRKGEVI